MNNKEFIQKFFKGRAVTRPPFIPLLGTYVTRVDQVKPEQLYSDPGTLVSAVSNTQQLLGYDPLIFPIDNTIEAEALGAVVEWKDEEMPSIEKNITADRPIQAETIQSAGRVPLILEAIERMEKVNGKDQPIIVTMTGPFTVLKQLYGENFLEELEPDLLEEKLEAITQSLVQLCKHYGDKKVSGILVYEDIDYDTYRVQNVKRFYSPVFNVIKYYNIFGILRIPEQTKEVTPMVSDTVIGSQEFLLQQKFRTKGISVKETFWDESFEKEHYRTLWHESKKRRLFFSTSKPLDTTIDLPVLQEKISYMCNQETWL
jgi:uroporphyrinogen-III decarboxylase